MTDCSDLKVGDFVAVWQSGWYANLAKHSVTRATKAMLVVDGITYNRLGYMRGGNSWSRGRIEPWNEAEHAPQLEQFKRDKRKRVLVNTLRETKWGDVDLEILETIIKMTKEVAK